MTALAPILERYFTERLAARGASPNTVASYRDTFCLLLRFAQVRTGKAPSRLDLADVDAALIGAFLDHLESERHNGVNTRNLRLTALHSLFSYAALRCPEHAALIQRVLAIPTKRPKRTMVTFLTRAETESLLASPDADTFLGRRDNLLLLVAVETGLRASELTGLVCRDVTFGIGANVYCWGKGRKERRTPLTASTAKALRAWIADRQADADGPLFPNRAGGHLCPDTLGDLVDKYVAIAAESCRSLRGKRVTPHTLRHTAAMNLLQAGVDTSTIALWLGHAGLQSTQAYLHADLTIKERALARTAPHVATRSRYRPSDPLLAFLENL